MTVKHIVKRLLPALVLAACLAGAALIWWFGTGKCLLTGRYMLADNGVHLVISDSGAPTVLSVPADCPDLFDSLEDGDRVLVVCGLILTSYPGQSEARWCLRLSPGSPEDLPQDTLQRLAQLGWLSHSLLAPDQAASLDSTSLLSRA